MRGERGRRGGQKREGGAIVVKNGNICLMSPKEELSLILHFGITA